MAEGTVAADQLRLFIERIERLEEEKKGIADDVRDVYAEAKANGYDTKTMRAIVRLRKMETHARQEAGRAAGDLSPGARAWRKERAMAGHSKYQEHHVPEGGAGQEALRPLLQAQPRNHRRGQDGPARPRRERAPARRDHRRPRPVDAQGQYPAVDRQGVGGDAENYEEIRYEGFGPGGVAIIVEALTDNRNRTATNVRTIFSKNGGNLGASGSVSHGFERLGLIEYPASAGDADKVLEAAIEAGAEDVESDEGGHRIWTSIDSLHEVARALEPMLGESEGAKLAWKPSTEVEVRGDDAEQLMKLIDALEEDDDVQTVWGNYDVPEEELERLA